MPKTDREYLGLIPAAGFGTRVSPLPCSKEIFPIGFRENKSDRSPRPKVACAYLIERMRNAGIKKVIIVIRAGKWDIPGYLGTGRKEGVNIAYIVMRESQGVPYSIMGAYSFIKDVNVVFGFPDIMFLPEDIFGRLKIQHICSNADIILAVFPATDHRIMDMLEMSEDGTVNHVESRSSRPDLKYTWLAATWGPNFTRFIFEYIKDRNEGRDLELSMGEVIQRAIMDGLKVGSVYFNTTDYIDIGNPDNLLKAVGKSLHWRETDDFD